MLGASRVVIALQAEASIGCKAGGLLHRGDDRIGSVVVAAVCAADVVMEGATQRAHCPLLIGVGRLQGQVFVTAYACWGSTT